MSIQIETTSHKTAKPIIAGIFNIIIGSGCLLCVLGLVIAAAVLASLNIDLPMHASWLILFIAAPLAVVGVVSITGGVCEFQRRQWGWALAGSITTAFVSNILGIAAIVLTATSRNEFSR